MFKILSLCSLLWIGIAQVTLADNWGHWRGASGNGIALNAKPPTEWSATKNVKWKVDLPGTA